MVRRSAQPEQPTAVNPRRALTRDQALTDGSFAQHVIQVLIAAHPNWAVAATDDPSSLHVQQASVFLGNIYLETRDMPASRRDTTVVALVGRLVSDSDSSTAAFNAVRGMLRLQVVPVDYRKSGPGIVSRKLVGGVATVYTIDQPDRYELLSRSQLKFWGLPRARVEQEAIVNLEVASDLLPIVREDDRKGGAYVALAASDGYDAARLFLPRFMGRVRAALGSPYVFAGIPNRDVLVAWTPDFTRRRKFAAQVARDASRCAYPLTDALFVASEKGVRLANADEAADHGRQLLNAAHM